MRGGILVAAAAAIAGGSLPAGAAVGPDLGAARTFAALGGSTLTNTGATTYIVGDVGVSPGSAVTGLTQSQVTGGIYVGGSTEADAAHSDAALAYTFLAGMASDTNLTSTDLGGLTLSPGVYTFNTSAALTGAMFLDAGGDSEAVFVFQIGSTFTAASGSSVTVINGGADYDESKVYWQVGSSATIGTNSIFLGIIIANQSVTLETGTAFVGNALALNGAATLDSNAITSPPVQPILTDAPINLTAVLGGTPVIPGGDLEWEDASDNETEFRVYRRDGAGPGFVLIATVLSTDETGIGATVVYEDPLLEADMTYTYRVTAYGLEAGESVPSNEALLDTGEFVPVIQAPINLAAELTGTTEIPAADLEWNDASDNETEFRVYRRDGAGPAFVLIATIPSTTVAGTGALVTFTDPVLVPEATYTYRVTAFNVGDGESAPSNEALVDTGVVIPDVFAPMDLTAVLSGTEAAPGADLSFTDASDNETEFRIYRRDGAATEFVLVGIVPSTTTVATGGIVTHQDLLLDPSSTFTYYVTAFNAVDGESEPSNEALVDTGLEPVKRWLDLDLGRRRSVIRDRYVPNKDRVHLKGSITVIDVYAGVPTVMEMGDVDPRILGVTIQVRAPGNILLVNIPANDPDWRVSDKGVYRWSPRVGHRAPKFILRINTRKSEFTFRARRQEFGAIPVNDITVSLSCGGAMGSDVRTWNRPKHLEPVDKALFTIPR